MTDITFVEEIRRAVELAAKSTKINRKMVLGGVVERHLDKILNLPDIADSLRAELVQERKHRVDAYRLQDLRLLCGFSQNGSSNTVRLFEDDATRDWICKVNSRMYVGKSLNEALDAAILAMQVGCSHPDTKADPDCIHLHLCCDCGAVI